MVLTREQSKNALEHVLTVVFGLPQTDPLVQALTAEGIEDMEELLSLHPRHIDQLSVVDASTGTATPVRKPRCNLIHAFHQYVIHQEEIGDPIAENWTGITQDQFNAYRRSPAYIASKKGTTISPASTGTATSTANRPSPSPVQPRPVQRDPVNDFKKGIKRDVSTYPMLKDEKQWDNWNRSLKSLAHAHDIYQVIDASYTPTTQEDIELFDFKQKFMYAVFQQTVLTDQGKALVRAHESDFDARAVYMALADYASKSTKSSLEASRILGYLTNAKLGDGSWKNSAQTFILHWQEQLRVYETLIPLQSAMSDDMKRIMLQNAVFPIDMLRAVKTQADQHKTIHGVDLNYRQYCDLLLSAAINYDGGMKPRVSQNNRRAVYSHELNGDDPNDVESYDDSYDIDMPVDVIEANVNKSIPSSRNSLHRLPPNIWKGLSAEAQTAWVSIPEADRRIILGNAKSTASTNSTKQLSSPSVPNRSTFLHSIEETANDDIVDSEPSAAIDDTPEEASTDLLAMVTKRQRPPSKIPPPTDVRRLLSTQSSKEPDEIKVGGKVYRLVNATILYSVSASNHKQVSSALVDRGANGGIAGDDVRIIEKTLRHVDIQGIDNHQVNNIPIVTAGGVVQSQRGPVIAILHQYAYVGRGRSIHSSGQLEWYKNQVDDRSCRTGGSQTIVTIDGYVHPINIIQGLPYVKIRPYTDDEWDTLPHVIWTSDADWDPSVLDHSLDDTDDWFESVPDVPIVLDDRFDIVGDYRHTVQVQDASVSPVTVGPEQVIDDILLEFKHHLYSVNYLSSHQLKETNKHDFEVLRPFFGWLPVDLVKKTFNVTTQYARMPMSTVLKKRFKSPNPALNVHRRNEAIATDTVYSDVPAIDGGEIAAQIFVGMDSLVTDVFGMKSDKQFVNTFEDIIRRRGAPTKLISDRAQVEISNKVKDILRSLCISDWQSEPHQQHQNPCERRYQTLKSMTNTVLERTGSPAYLWLLCLQYVAFILNNSVSDALNGTTPLQLLTGSTNDISPLLFFKWYDPVYYKVDDSDFPSESREKRGRWVGIAEHVGHAMTFKILSDDSNKVLYRSNIRLADDPKSVNLREEPLSISSDVSPVIQSRHDSPTSDHGEPPAPIVDPTELVGRTFLLPPQEDGQRFRARIIRAIGDQENELERSSDRLEFLCSLNDDERE